MKLIKECCIFKELITGLPFNEKQEETVIFYPVSYLSNWYWI